MSKERFVFLDGLRGLVAITVTVFHLLSTFAPRQLIERGHLGVDFFFALSGFVIAAAYETRLAGDMSLALFIEQRAVRLYPMIFFSALLCMLLGSSDPLRTALLALCLPTFLLDSSRFVFGANVPLWSMFFEIVINVIYAAILYRMRSRALITIAAVALGALVLVIARFHTFDVGSASSNFAGGLPRVAMSFVAGVLLFRCRPRQELPLLNWAVGVAIAAGLTVLFFVPATRVANGTIDLIIVAVALPCVLLVSSRVQASGRFAAVCELGGDISYPLYLIHLPILTALKPFYSGLTDIGRLSFLALAPVLLSCLAYVVFKLYDKPVRAWLARRLSARSSTPIHAR